MGECIIGEGVHWVSALGEGVHWVRARVLYNVLGEGNHIIGYSKGFSPNLAFSKMTPFPQKSVGYSKGFSPKFGFFENDPLSSKKWVSA